MRSLRPRRLQRVVALPELGGGEAGMCGLNIGSTHPVVFPAEVFEVLQRAEHFDIGRGFPPQYAQQIPGAGGLPPVFDPLAMRVLVGFRGLGWW